MAPIWNQLWSQVSLIEELATAGSGTVNALYFGAHSLRGGMAAPRRTAALVLVALRRQCAHRRGGAGVRRRRRTVGGGSAAAAARQPRDLLADPRGRRPVTALSMAIGHGQYELAALRLLLGAAEAIEQLKRSAPQTRAQLLALLTVDDA